MTSQCFYYRDRRMCHGTLTFLRLKNGTLTGLVCSVMGQELFLQDFLGEIATYP